MATLTIRNLPADLHDSLRRQAATNRRSMEAEARAVLQAGVRLLPDEANRRRALRELREMGRRMRPANLPEGWSLTDEFLAEKHLEGAWENELITREELVEWGERLDRREVWPAEIEAFLATRIAD